MELDLLGLVLTFVFKYFKRHWWSLSWMDPKAIKAEGLFREEFVVSWIEFLWKCNEFGVCMCESVGEMYLWYLGGSHCNIMPITGTLPKLKCFQSLPNSVTETKVSES